MVFAKVTSVQLSILLTVSSIPVAIQLIGQHIKDILTKDCVPGTRQPILLHSSLSEPGNTLNQVLNLEAREFWSNPNLPPVEQSVSAKGWNMPPLIALGTLYVLVWGPMILHDVPIDIGCYTLTNRKSILSTLWTVSYNWFKNILSDTALVTSSFVQRCQDPYPLKSYTILSPNRFRHSREKNATLVRAGLSANQASLGITPSYQALKEILKELTVVSVFQ